MRLLLIKMAIINSIAIFASNINLIIAVIYNIIMLITAIKKYKNESSSKNNNRNQ